MKGGFNDLPEYCGEIREDQFGSIFFHYIFKEPVFRQVCKDPRGNDIPMKAMKFFEVDYSGWEDMGIAMHYNYKEKRMQYYQFGSSDRWKVNQGKFAAQFAGDNS